MRKKTILILTILLVAVFFGSLSIQAQPKTALYNAPQRLILKGDEKGEGEENLSRLIIENFYPIGWSKDGKFAYYTEPPDEACGCYFGTLYIQDLRTDKILWKNEYEGQENAVEDIKSHWRKNQKLFSGKLAEHGIKAVEKFSLLASPLQVASDSVKVDFFSDVALTEDVYNSKGSVVVKLVSQQKGTKTVYQEKYDGTGYNGIMNIEQGGILQSPFEPRAAVILVHTIRGWEGPPNITNVTIVGADLVKGFR